MKPPNLLATRAGRLTAFFALYMTEGIPLGFLATAIATQMRRQGLGPAEIGAFVGSLYLPWAFKWVVGPFVDTVYSERLGRRRMWIVLTQVMMIGTLMAALPVSFTTDLKLFTAIILIHNVFGATQDVAIDALAVNVLAEKERGLANGLMFSGAYVGQAVGGAGVLFLTPYVGFNNTFYFVAAALASVTVFVTLPLREPRGPPRPASPKSPFATASAQIVQFVKDATRAVVGSRSALVAVFFALLPTGAMGLGLALQSNLAVELGLDDNRIAQLNLWSTIITALGCVAGGWCSDRFGRRRMLALFTALMSAPTLYLAVAMQHAGWIHAIDPQLPNRPVPAVALVWVFWGATLTYAVFQGLMYGVRTALFMDVTTPKVAATQFTAYMALLNAVIAYSAQWQGVAIERWGYPVTLTIDATVGVVSLALLPLISRRQTTHEPLPGAVAVPDSVQP
jgi:PAT family beta-lactamase induction signal transducer AmpG